jgi:hypothetical protein
MTASVFSGDGSAKGRATGILHPVKEMKIPRPMSKLNIPVFFIRFPDQK